MGEEPGDNYVVRPAPPRKFSVGMLALLLLFVNAGVTASVSLAVGSGPQGLALAGLYVFFTVPLFLYVIFLAILSITGQQGRTPGTIALLLTATAFLYALYSMAAEGWA